MLHTISEMPVNNYTEVLSALASTFEERITAPDFPCVYAVLPLKTQIMYYSVLSESEAVSGGFYDNLRELVRMGAIEPDITVATFIPDTLRGPVHGMDSDLLLAQQIVSSVLKEDRDRHGEGRVQDCPTDSSWSLRIQDIDVFLNFSSPRHTRRRSRNVGPALTIVAQLRESFNINGRNSNRSRALIRSRLEVFDDVPVHPCLGSYGDNTNHEAQQYFLGDDNTAIDITTAR